MAESKRYALKRHYEVENDVETEDNKESLKTLLDQETEPTDEMGELTKRVRFLEAELEDDTKMLEANESNLETEDNDEFINTLLDQGSQPTDEMGELTKRVRSLEAKLEDNTKKLEANTRELAKSTLQVSKLTALLKLFLKGKAKDVALDVPFPIPNVDALAVVEFKINSDTKDAYIQAITDLLKDKALPKSLKHVLAEPLICDFNIDGVNGKKPLRAYPNFFSVLIQSIAMFETQQSPERALAHAMSCVKNNASKKKKNTNK